MTCLERAAAIAAALALAACAAESRSPPVSTNATGVPSQSQMPQPPGSLPLGSAVAAPLDHSDLPAVQVGPSRIGVRPF